MTDETNKLPYGVSLRDLEPIGMGDIEDLEKERREVKAFESSTTEGFIEREELLRLAKEGIELCHGVCMSRRYSGEHCKCIRERFFTESIYELYKESRNFFLRNLATGIIGEVIGDKNDKERLRKQNGRFK